MKTFAIEINGILRNFEKKFTAFYKKEFPEREIKEPIDPFKLTDSFFFEDGELEDFISMYAYELYGKGALPEKDEIAKINTLYNELKNLGYRVVLISRETIKARSLTSFFIANFSVGFYFDEMRFYTSYDDYFNEDFEYILTANKSLIEKSRKTIFYGQLDDENVVSVKTPIELIKYLTEKPD